MTVSKTKSQRINETINLMTITVFFASLTFAIVLPSLWFFVKLEGGSKSFYGWVVAVYSIGQLIFSLVLGHLANYWVSSKTVIAITLVLGTAGNLIYSLAQSKWLILVGRFLVGSAAACVSINRSVVSHLTDDSNRVTAMAKLSAAQGIGFIIGPGIGAGIGLIPNAFKNPSHGLAMGRFTFVGYLCAVFDFINLILLYKMFTYTEFEKPKGDEITKSPTKDENTTQTSHLFRWSGSAFPKIGYVSANILFFLISSVFAVFETICVPFTAEVYNWGELYNGILFSVVGVIAVFTYVGLGKIKDKYDDRKVMLFGIVITLGGFAFLVIWDHLAAGFEVHSKSTSLSSPLDKDIKLWQFLVGAAIQCIGFPISQVMSFTIFSKICPPEILENSMGIFTASGSLARVVGPLYASYVLDYFGAYLVFFIVFCLLIVSILLTLGTWKSLIPFVVWATPERLGHYIHNLIFNSTPGHQDDEDDDIQVDVDYSSSSITSANSLTDETTGLLQDS